MSPSSPSLPRLTEADVRRLTDSRSFDRGRRYYDEGNISDPVRQGNELRAYCEGSQDEPYRVRVTLDEKKGVTQTDCSCPIGVACKHVVALLLTWVHKPESFHEMPPLDDLLSPRSKEELILLIKEMLKREPDLESLLELPLTPGQPVASNLEAYRRQLNRALRHDDPQDVASDLDTLCDVADQFFNAKDYSGSSAIFSLILSEIVSDYEELGDEDGDIAIVLDRCAEGLGRSLGEGKIDPATRRGWLEVLLDAYLQNIELGGIDLAPTASDAILRHATDEEWAWIEDRLRQLIEQSKKQDREWARECLVSFLAERREQAGDQEASETLISEMGTPEQRAFLWVRQGRLDEAVAIAREHFASLPGLVLQFADALVAANAGPAAVEYLTGQMAQNRTTRSYAYHYVPWLARYFQAQGDYQAALEWWQRHFRETTPSLATYQVLRDLAQRLQVWDSLRPQLRAILDESKGQAGILIDVALDEGDVRVALETLPRVPLWSPQAYHARVAQAAEKDYPREALALYRQMAERAIDGRGRDNYQEAARLLVRARDLYRRLDEAAQWRVYIEDLRQQHRRLRALQEELDRADL